LFPLFTAGDLGPRLAVARVDLGGPAADVALDHAGRFLALFLAEHIGSKLAEVRGIVGGGSRDKEQGERPKNHSPDEGARQRTLRGGHKSPRKAGGSNSDSATAKRRRYRKPGWQACGWSARRQAAGNRQNTPGDCHNPTSGYINTGIVYVLIRNPGAGERPRH